MTSPEQPISPTQRGPKLVAYFVRHGRTGANGAGIFRGNTNYPLNDGGVKDAEQLNKVFKPLKVGAAYTSDADRSTDTAERTLEGKGISASPTSALESWNTGYISGTKKKDNQYQLDWFTNNPSEDLPGGESLNDFRKRVQPALKNSITRGIKDGVPSITFTHSSVIHELSHLLYGDPAYIKVKPGGIVGVFHDGKSLRAKALFKGAGHADTKYGS